MSRRLLYVVTEDWYFLSHRLPMARAAKADGYEVHVATRVDTSGDAIRAEGFQLHKLKWQRGSFAPREILTGVAELRRLFRHVAPDIVHNIAMKPVLLGTLASLGLARISVVNSITGLGTLFIGEAQVSAMVRKAVPFLLKHLLRRPNSKTIVQNPDDLAFVKGLGVPDGKIVLIPGSGVDLSVFQPLPEPPPPITAAYVGRMLADKGIMTLIDAFAALRARGVPLLLLLAGDCDKENPGSLAPEQLREFAGAFGIDWLGHVTDIREVWERAHFAVLPSRREGLPKSLLEAAACGRALVATDVPGCREVAIEGQTGLLFPIDNAEGLAAAMEKLTQDAGLRHRLGADARKLVEEKFSAEKIGAATVALYDSLIAAPRP